jgi:hypothetical protein
VSNSSRGETLKFSTTETVWQAVATLIDELDAGDRCVEYAVEGSVRSYDWIDAWLTKASAEGHDTVRYIVDPDHFGLVRVDFVSIESSRRE